MFPRHSLPLIAIGAVLAPTLARAQLSQSVQFYFSDAGGTNERLLQDTVTGPNWTKEYDVFVKSLWQQDIVFNGCVLLIGYARSISAGPNTPFIAGSDKVSIRYPEQALNSVATNPNIVGRSPWWLGNVHPLLSGGLGAIGPERPYGFNVSLDMAANSTQTLHVGETMFLGRFVFKNNSLLLPGDTTQLSLFNGGPGNLGTTSLIDDRGPAPLSYRTGNWATQSTLNLVLVPETPVSVALSIAAVLTIGVHRRRAT